MRTYRDVVFLLLAGSIMSSSLHAQQFEATSAPFHINFNAQGNEITRGQRPVSTAPEEKVARKYYALLIGVDEYQDQRIPSLNEATKDAARLKDVLVTKYTFEDSDITLMLNPTFEDLNVAFEKLVTKISKEDLLLIFYAGHGMFDDRTNIGYWLPSDATQDNKAKWFRNSALVESIGAINSKHTLLIADACFAGGIFKTRSVTNNASPDLFEVMKRPSRKAMTSGSLTTVPDKSKFMEYLMKSLEENQLQYLSSEDLYYNIRLAMKNNANTKPLYGEIRNAGDEGGNFVLIQRKDQ